MRKLLLTLGMIVATYTAFSQPKEINDSISDTIPKQEIKFNENYNKNGYLIFANDTISKEQIDLNSYKSDTTYTYPMINGVNCCKMNITTEFKRKIPGLDIKIPCTYSEVKYKELKK